MALACWYISGMAEPLDMFARRLAAIAEELAALKERLAMLDKEADRIRNAEQVVRDLMGEEVPGRELAESEAEANKAEAAISRSRPANLPPMPTMIEQALRDAHERGIPALQPVQITTFVRKHFWPEAEVVSVGPIAWRMWKRDQIGKDARGYFTPDRDWTLANRTKKASVNETEAERDDAERDTTPQSVSVSNLFG